MLAATPRCWPTGSATSSNTRSAAATRCASCCRPPATARPPVRPAMPVLVMAGALDRLVDHRCSQRLARAWQADCLIHRDAGHDLPLDEGQWVAQSVARWLGVAATDDHKINTAQSSCQISNHTEQLTALVEAGVREHIFPGAAWAVGTVDHSVMSAAGWLTPEPASAAMQVDTLFDIASLTKIVSVWSLIGPAGEAEAPRPGQPAGRRAARHGRLCAGAHHDFPAAHAHGRPAAARPPARQLWRGVRRYRARRAARAAGRRTRPGRGIHGPRGPDPRPGHRAAAGHAAGAGACRVRAAPAGHGRHGLRPCGATARPAGRADRILRAGGQRTCAGVVHDFSTRLLGGVCGISGLFSNVPDLERFLRAMLAPRTARCSTPTGCALR